VSRAAIAVLSIGGEALFRRGESGTQREQIRSARRAGRAIAALVREGYRVVVTHGGRAQLERELARNVEAATKLPPQALDLCVASTQGGLGYLIATEARNELRRLRIERPITSIMTWTLVGLDDPAFREPATLIGPRLTRWQAQSLSKSVDARFAEQGEQAWLRVVASPLPLEILNLEAVEALLDRGHVVMACGVGGVPMAVDARGQIIGVEALVDADRAASLLAQHIGAEVFVMLTGVDTVFREFGRSEQRACERVSAAELRGLLEEGHFPFDTMGPKVEAALEFVEDGGVRAVITSLPKLSAALADRGGTRVMRVVDEGPIRRQIPLFPAPPEHDLLEYDA